MCLNLRQWEHKLKKIYYASKRKSCYYTHFLHTFYKYYLTIQYFISYQFMRSIGKGCLFNLLKNTINIYFVTNDDWSNDDCIFHIMYFCTMIISFVNEKYCAVLIILWPRDLENICTSIFSLWIVFKIIIIRIDHYDKMYVFNVIVKNN